MLIGADAVEAELGRQHQFVDRPVVNVGDLVSVAVLPPRCIDPSRRQPSGKILGQVTIGHEMKHRDLHGPSSFYRIKPMSDRLQTCPGLGALLGRHDV